MTASMESDVIKKSLESILEQKLEPNDLELFLDNEDDQFPSYLFHDIWINDNFLHACEQLKKECKSLQKKCQKVPNNELEDKQDTRQCKRNRRVRLWNGLPIYDDLDLQFGDEEENIQSGIAIAEKDILTANSASPIYPHLGDGENKIISAYHDDKKTVGYERKSSCSEIATYNNPFDPRLKFNGLLVKADANAKNEDKKAEPRNENYFFSSTDVIQCYEEFLDSYRKTFVSTPEFQNTFKTHDKNDNVVKPIFTMLPIEDDGSEECRQLFERIRSDKVRSLWANISTNLYGTSWGEALGESFEKGSNASEQESADSPEFASFQKNLNNKNESQAKTSTPKENVSQGCPSSCECSGGKENKSVLGNNTGNLSQSGITMENSSGRRKLSFVDKTSHSESNCWSSTSTECKIGKVDPLKDQARMALSSNLSANSKPFQPTNKSLDVQAPEYIPKNHQKPGPSVAVKQEFIRTQPVSWKTVTSLQNNLVKAPIDNNQLSTKASPNDAVIRFQKAVHKLAQKSGKEEEGAFPKQPSLPDHTSHWEKQEGSFNQCPSNSLAEACTTDSNLTENAPKQAFALSSRPPLLNQQELQQKINEIQSEHIQRQQQRLQHQRVSQVQYSNNRTNYLQQNLHQNQLQNGSQAQYQNFYFQQQQQPTLINYTLKQPLLQHPSNSHVTPPQLNLNDASFATQQFQIRQPYSMQQQNCQQFTLHNKNEPFVSTSYSQWSLMNQKASQINYNNNKMQSWINQPDMANFTYPNRPMLNTFQQQPIQQIGFSNGVPQKSWPQQATVQNCMPIISSYSHIPNINNNAEGSSRMLESNTYVLSNESQERSSFNRTCDPDLANLQPYTNHAAGDLAENWTILVSQNNVNCNAVSEKNNPQNMEKVDESKCLNDVPDAPVKGESVLMDRDVPHVIVGDIMREPSKDKYKPSKARLMRSHLVHIMTNDTV